MANQYIRQLMADNTGKTAAELLPLAQANTCTIQAIQLVDLTPWLRTGVGARIAATIADPRLEGVVVGLGKPWPETLYQLRDGYDYITGASHNKQLDTTDKDIAEKTVGLLALMQGFRTNVDPTLGITAGEAAEFLAFGGGFRLGPATTVEQVQTELDAAASEKAVAGKRALVAAAKNAVDQRIAVWENGVAAEPTPQELSDLFAAVMSPQ